MNLCKTFGFISYSDNNSGNVFVIQVSMVFQRSEILKFLHFVHFNMRFQF